MLRLLRRNSNNVLSCAVLSSNSRAVITSARTFAVAHAHAEQHGHHDEHHHDDHGHHDEHGHHDDHIPEHRGYLFGTKVSLNYFRLALL